MGGPWCSYLMSSNSSVSELDRLAGLRGAKRAVGALVRESSGVHGVLLYGAEGSGKSQLARILARAWLCTNPGEEGACGECKACVAASKGLSADLQIIEPYGPSRWIKIDAIYGEGKREGDSKDADEKNKFQGIAVQRFFMTPPLSARNKVIIIDDADRMTPAASNAMLKTLEEPPEKAKLILITTRVGQIQPTILSRCLAIACELPGIADLVSQFGDLTPAEHILSGGAPQAIERMRAGPTPYVRLIELAEGLSRRLPREALAIADEFRAICAELGKEDDLSARAANAEGLKLLSTALARINVPAEWVQLAIEAHRLVQGNVNAAYAFDALFASMRSV